MAQSLPHPPTSLFDRFVSRQQPGWVRLLVSLLLLLLPFGAAALDGMLNDILRQGQWRFLLLAPTIILYIWLVSSRMARVGGEVVIAFRPLLTMDDEDFDRLVYENSLIQPASEGIAIGIGFILGLLSTLAAGLGGNTVWLRIYWFVTAAWMYSLLAWTVYVSIASIRVNTAMHRQPLQIDPLDPTPFDVIGRYSLLLALVFVGGITLSVLLTFQRQNFTSPGFWLGYLSQVLLTVLIFFLSMRPTHRVLAAAKKRELRGVQRHLHAACRELTRRLDLNQATGGLPAEIAALAVYEERLQVARTWPYNTPMLRTLFFSVFIPLLTVLVRVLAEILF